VTQLVTYVLVYHVNLIALMMMMIVRLLLLICYLLLCYCYLLLCIVHWFINVIYLSWFSVCVLRFVSCCRHWRDVRMITWV